MKKLASLLIVASFTLVLLPVAGSAHTEGAPFVTDLLAGQHEDVGDVSVWNDGGGLHVKYDTTASGWVMTETHLYVGSEAPIKSAPGQFPYKHEDLGGVTIDSYTISGLSGTVYIAAQAVVQNLAGQMTTSVVSDTDTMVDGGPAVEAWEPWDGTDPSVWDDGVSSSYTFDPLADWIWESYLPTHPLEGDIVEFVRTFDVPGYPTGGTLYITCDNAYEVHLNGNLVGWAHLPPGWPPPVDLTGAWPYDGNSWPGVEQWDVLTWLVSGLNTLEITGVNEYYGPDDGEPPGENVGQDSTNNPAGLIFELGITSVPEESAWGQGDEIRPGKEWAMYFTYTMQ